MKWTDESNLGEHQNSSGERFRLSLKRWQEPQTADYRLYVITASHDNWGHRHFKVHVTKAKYPGEADARAVVQTHALDKALVLLNDADKSGSGLDPTFGDGWYMV